MTKRGLGKGLDALFALEEGETRGRLEIAIEDIVVKEGQPRKKFAEEAIKELAESIKNHGILQPLLVRPGEDGKFELVAGERRLRAAKTAGLDMVPAVVRELDDAEAREAALVENLQREDLSPVEEAMAYREMMEVYQYTQEELSARIGKSRSHIANTRRLLNLPREVLELIEDGRLTAGHGRAILALKGEKDQVRLAEKIVGGGLSVRESEARTKKKKPEPSPEVIGLKEKIEDRLGTRVRVNQKKRGGVLEIEYYNLEDLERILEIIGIDG